MIRTECKTVCWCVVYYRVRTLPTYARTYVSIYVGASCTSNTTLWLDGFLVEGFRENEVQWYVYVWDRERWLIWYERERERERVKHKRTTGMDGDERNDKAGGRIKLLIWDPPFSYFTFPFLFQHRFFIIADFLFPILSFSSPFCIRHYWQLCFGLVYNMGLIKSNFNNFWGGKTKIIELRTVVTFIIICEKVIIFPKLINV